VLVHGRRPLPAIVVQPPDYLVPDKYRGQPIPMEYLFVDTGLLPAQVTELVRPGDPVSFAQEPLELSGETIVGHTLDNRASVAALTCCLQELKHMRHSWDVYAVATVQEEETFAGGYTSPFDIRPDIAIAVDVTFAKGPGANDYKSLPLGKGVALGWGPNIHPAIYKGFKELAERLDVPTHFDPMPVHSGTDAYPMQVVQEGIPTMVLSIPLRYMHTPVELTTLKDLTRTGMLLAEYIARLEPDAMQNIRWED
jgi:putative aminopeptidase FrvX